MTDTLGSIITAIVTPFDQAGDVDEEGFPLVARSVLQLERQFLGHDTP